MARIPGINAPASKPFTNNKYMSVPTYQSKPSPATTTTTTTRTRTGSSTPNTYMSVPEEKITQEDITNVPKRSAQEVLNQGSRITPAFKPQNMSPTPSRSIGFNNQISSTAPAYINQEDKTITEVGNVLVTQEEGKTISQTSTKSFIPLQSTNIFSGITEVGFYQGVPTGRQDIIFERADIYKQYNQILTDFEANPSSFRGQRGVQTLDRPEGQQIILTSDYFNRAIDFQGAKLKGIEQAKIRYNEAPILEKYKDVGKGASIGVAQTAIGVGEFIDSLTFSGLGGLQTEGRKFGFFQMDKVQYGGKYLEISSISGTPGSAFEGARKGAIIGSNVFIIGSLGLNAGKTIRTLGVRSGTLETIKSALPINIKSETIIPAIKPNEQLIAKGIQYQSGDTLTRFVTAKTIDQAITIRTTETFKTGKGGKITGEALTTYEVPYIKFSANNFEVGTKISQYVSIIEPRGSGEAARFLRGDFGVNVGTGANLPAGIADIKTTTLNEVFIPRGAKPYEATTPQSFSFVTGGTMKQLREGSQVFRFSSGEAKALYKLEVGADYFIYKPSGKFRYSPRVVGDIYDVSNIGNTQFRSRGKLTPGSSNVNTIQSLKVVEQIAPTITIPKAVTKQVYTSDLKAVSLSLNKERNALKVQATQVSVTQIATIKSQTTQSQIGATISLGTTTDAVLKTTASNQNVFAQLPIISQITSPAITQINKGISISPIGNNLPGFASPIDTISFIPAGFLPKLAGIDTGLRKSLFAGGRKKVFYVPSFSAIVLGRQGKYNPGALAKSGLDFRPFNQRFKVSKKRGGNFGL